jgi:hypothetical protein
MNIVALDTGRPNDALGWIQERLQAGVDGFTVVSYNKDGTFTTVHLGSINFFAMSAAGFTMQKQAHDGSVGR